MWWGMVNFLPRVGKNREEFYINSTGLWLAGGGMSVAGVVKVRNKHRRIHRVINWRMCKDAGHSLT